MFRTGLIIFFLLCQTLSPFAPPLFSQDAFVIYHKDPFVIHYESNDIAYAKEAAKILSTAYEELAFDFKLDRTIKFDVFIMPTRHSFRQALQGRLPDWTGAFANPMYNRMVVKSPRWNPDDSFQNTLVHELVHLVIHRYLGVRDIPRWLDEGLAIFYSGEERWKTNTALSKAISTHSLIPLADIDYVLDYHRVKADLAYQQSYSAVYYLLTTYDIDAVRQILKDIRDGISLQQSFYNATGSRLDDFEREWQSHVRKTHRWMWIYEIQDYIWIFIFLLVLLAFIVRMIRNKQTERRWLDEQDRAQQMLQINDADDLTSAENADTTTEAPPDDDNEV